MKKHSIVITRLNEFYKVIPMFFGFRIEFYNDCPFGGFKFNDRLLVVFTCTGSSGKTNNEQY